MASRFTLPRDEYDELVQRVLARDGYKCRACKSTRNLTAHHIQFRSEGGQDKSQNLCTLCNFKCHLAVHGRGNLFIQILAADGDPDKLPNADEGLTFKRYPTVRRRIRWRNLKHE